MNDDIERRLVRVRAENAVAHARSLAGREPTWGAEVEAFVGGWLVLAGPGMYLNQAMGAGIDPAAGPGELDRLVARSATVGVTPAFEVTPATAPASVAQLAACGFAADADDDITVLTVVPDQAAVSAPADVAIRPVHTAEELRRWQDTSAEGWGHVDDGPRRANDAFAAAADAVEGEYLVIAVDAVDDRPIGCASTTVRDGVAMLGGMSTPPRFRRRGVHAALIRHRLRHARNLGCDLAVATAAAGGDSERNLRRHGFAPAFTVQRFERVVPR